MTSSTFSLDRILGARPFAEVGDSVLTVADKGRGLLAVAGAYDHDHGTARVGVYQTGDLACRALLRAHHPVHAMAFHPALLLLAVGTGAYDGGYFFEGELLLLDLETGASRSLFEEGLGRQVLGLEWSGKQDLRVLMAPPDDWEDDAAHVEGHVATVSRSDWMRVPPRSVTYRESAGPRVAAPRPDGREAARHAISALTARRDPRRNVRAVRELSDGRILATLDGVALECRRTSGERQWSVPDAKGGRDIVVAPDERSAWVGLVPPGGWGEPCAQEVVRLSLEDGTCRERRRPSVPVTVVDRADGSPAFSPAGDNGPRSRLRIRRGTRTYLRLALRDASVKAGREGETWLAAVDPDAIPAAERPREPAEAEVDRLFPYSWNPHETHFAGPGAEVANDSLVYAGTVYDGRGLQPGGSFVVRRELTGGRPLWVFRTDHPATDLDCDTDTAYVSYTDGELVMLDLRDGSVRRRHHLTVAGVPVVPTALTVPGPGRLLIGTDDGRILDCSVGHRPRPTGGRGRAGACGRGDDGAR